MCASKSKYIYENRELSWLKFNRRVLEESLNDYNPILEKIKFVSITSSNLDEFFMVRVASLRDMYHDGADSTDIAGIDVETQLDLITKDVHSLVDDQYDIYMNNIVDSLRENGIEVIDDYKNLTKEQIRYVDSYFTEEIYPVLTPMAVDASRPFPLVRNKTLNIAALIKRNPEFRSNYRSLAGDEYELSTVQVPSVLPRIISVPSAEGIKNTFVLLETIIKENIYKLYIGYDILATGEYRIMRNADFTLDEDEAHDLLKEIEKQIVKRQWGEVIRLEISSSTDARIVSLLKSYLEIQNEEIYYIPGPLDLTFLMKLSSISGKSSLKLEPFSPQPNPRFAEYENIFDEIKKGDVFLSHPYESFDPVVDFIGQAADDDDVLAIKQTLYRVSGNSPIIASLERAAENGKQVTVLVELKARFDEENNIIWARRLEKAGAHVIYGILGLKTHCKISLVVRREPGGIVRYVHMGTGNYNDSTAKLYTDCGLFTCDVRYGEDASAVFNMLSGYSEPSSWNRLILAPIWLRDKFIQLIEREIAFAEAGGEGFIIAKMNSLCDKKIINKLYEASKAGVRVELIVRGICSLRAGIPGMSDFITVRSIVGTYLEHSRIFYFNNGGDPDVYMGSADWMPRNLDKRVELVFPIESDDIRKQIKHLLDVILRDNTNARFMDENGEYHKLDITEEEAFNSQMALRKEAIEVTSQGSSENISREFVPVMAPREI